MKIIYLMLTKTERSEGAGLRSQAENLFKKKYIKPPPTHCATNSPTIKLRACAQKFILRALLDMRCFEFPERCCMECALISNTSISEGIAPFYMPPKIRNSEKDASRLKDALDFLDLKYSAPRDLHVLLEWTFVVSKIELPAMWFVWALPALSHEHVLLQVEIQEWARG